MKLASKAAAESGEKEHLLLPRRMNFGATASDRQPSSVHVSLERSEDSLSKHRMQSKKLYKWNPSGINLNELLRFFNDSYTGTYEQIDGEYSWQFGAFPAFVVNTKDFGPELWASTSVMLRRSRGSIAGRLLALFQPFFNKALRELNDDATVANGISTDYPALKQVLERTGILPLAFQLDDYTGCANRNYHIGNDTTLTIPVFTLCADVACPNSLALPTYKMWQYSLYDTPDEWSDQFGRWDREYPWHKKIPKLYWRGSCTHYKSIFAPASVRYHVVNASLEHTEYMDVMPVGARETSRCSRDGVNFTPPEWSMNYRAVLDMDGNSWSERFPKLLCYNSVVVKMEPRYVEYFWPMLQSGVHYLSANEANLTAVAQFIAANENQAKLREIVVNANRWCSRQMTQSQLKVDFLSILNGYVEELSIYDGGWLSWWEANYVHYIRQGEKDFFREYRYVVQKLRRKSTDLHPMPLHLNRVADNELSK